jgi:hypothetical protein
LREQYRVTYPGYEPRTLNIITENLHAAESGNVRMQASFAWQFFKALGFNQPRNWDWRQFIFTATGEAGRPPRHARDAHVERYGCTCERDCASCDQGWHQNCSYDCWFGQEIIPQ